MGDHPATGRAALVDQLAEVAQEGAGAWQELVENLITAQERRERRLAGTSA